MLKSFTAFLLTNPNFSADPTKSRRAFLQSARTGAGTESVLLEAENFDDVYAQLNHGSGRELAGYKGRSLSMGDLIMSWPDQKLVMVSAHGFSELELFPE